jgi:two-component system OmpR family response regulator
MKHVLLIGSEDDAFASDLLSGYLQSHGYIVTSTRTGQHGLAMIDSGPVDLALLDLQLGDASGIDVLRRIRARSPVPVVVMSKSTDTDEKIQALDAGADDFIVRPFDPLEMASRMRAIMRRSSLNATPANDDEYLEYQFDNWRFRPINHELLGPNGTNIPLTPAEFQLFSAFVKSPMRVLSRDQLLDSFTRRDAPPVGRSVDVLVSRIRRKMAGASGRVRYIHTVQGIGYRFGARVSTSPD